MADPHDDDGDVSELDDRGRGRGRGGRHGGRARGRRWTPMQRAKQLITRNEKKAAMFELQAAILTDAVSPTMGRYISTQILGTGSVVAKGKEQRTMLIGASVTTCETNLKASMTSILDSTVQLFLTALHKQMHSATSLVIQQWHTFGA